MAPAILQQVMHTTSADISGAAVYPDDIIITASLKEEEFYRLDTHFH